MRMPINPALKSKQYVAVAGLVAFLVANASTVQAETFSGWVSFRGEFLLYPSRRAMLAEKNEGCLSGALPLTQQRIAMRKYQHKHVDISGYKERFALAPLALSMNNRGSPITNICSSEFVIFANKIRMAHGAR